MPSLSDRIRGVVNPTLDAYPGAWLVWCDPHGVWAPLLERAGADPRSGGFHLERIASRTAARLGGPVERRRLAELVTAGSGFVLAVAGEPADLGWLWAHALRAESIYARPLRDQLQDWGWQPQSLSIEDSEVAAMAAQGLDQDPAAWGGGGLAPDVTLLLEVLAGARLPDESVLLDLTASHFGLAPVAIDDVDAWRRRSVARLLVAQARERAPDLVPDTHELLPPADSRGRATELLDRWTDSLRLSRGLADAVIDADRSAALGGLLAPASLGHGPFVSHTAESLVLANTCRAWAALSGETLLEAIANSRDDLACHERGFWGAERDHPKGLPWDELVRLSDAARALRAAAAISGWATPGDAVRWFVDGGWRVDRAGEELLRGLARSTPEVIGLMEPLRAAYRARWEQILIQWSDLWRAAGCPAPELPTAGAWLAGQLAGSPAAAVIVVDALRFDLGAALAEAVNRAEGAMRATVSPARAPLPTITVLGMGAALPVAETELEADLVDGKWHLVHRPTGLDLSLADQRRVWWRDQGGVASEGFLSLGDVLNRAIPAPSEHCRRLVVADATIDTLGHDDQLELAGTSQIVTRYADAVAALREAGWRRVFIVTDHGFIHWAGADDRGLAPPRPSPAWKARRAIVYRSDQTAGLAAVPVMSSRWQVVPAPGAASWSAYGGLGYFHGGASLQEWIIPCVAVHWPEEAKPVGARLLPLDRVLSERPRVTLAVERGSLFIEGAMPRRIEVVVREAATRVILFRSVPTDLMPSHTQVDLVLDLVKGAHAPRGSRLTVEVRDVRTEETLATADSELSIEVTDW